MKLLNKIMAYFTFKGERQQMELSGAEIRGKGVFLHPVDDPKHVFFVKSNKVDILINNNEELLEENISVIDKETVKNDVVESGETVDLAPQNRKNGKRTSYISFMPTKRRFSVMLYQDEYEMLIKNISEHGYKKAEYFLACVNAAKKQSFDTTYKRYAEEHKKRYRADLTEAKKALVDASSSSRD